MKKIFRTILYVLGLGALIRLGKRFLFLNTVAPGAVGLAAKQLCSLIYVCGLEPEMARTRYIDPLIAALDIPVSVKYDDTRRRVTATSYGMWSATAEMRDGLGATLITKIDKNAHLAAVELPAVSDKPLQRATPEKYGKTFDPEAVETALDQAFLPEHHTLAVAVLHGGKLVTERYADGIGPTTSLPGWSMAKSVTATLVGLLVQQGRLDMNQPGIVPDWRGANDGREQVTLNHLLRMTSGLDLTEDQSGADPNTRLLFVEPDAAAFAASRGLKAPPGTHWEYMSGSTVLACRAIYHATGGTLESSQRFYQDAFFSPLGATSFVLEPDAAGTFIGSSYALATARDWAKFGQLYLQDGIWEGQRLLPKGWRDYVTQYTPQSGANSYGAGFWTLEHSELAGLPRDTFYANGFQGQYVIVVPSRSLVLVRLGASLGPDGIWQLLGDIISAMN
jgi:CubicO group peptidase (beta-lactamase class C family)